jgi:hypothetical protein
MMREKEDGHDETSTGIALDYLKRNLKEKV